jgi:hypothetical protein
MNVFYKVFIAATLAIGLIVGQTAVFGATFTVSNISDAGAGSLRKAILDANANPGADDIDFSIAGTIQPLTALPDITDAVNMDATTAPGYAGAPLVELDGQLFASGNGLTLNRHFGSTIKGLVINRFPGHGIFTNGGDHVIAGNYIGTDITGKLASANGLANIWLNFPEDNILIGIDPLEPISNDRNVFGDFGVNAPNDHLGRLSSHIVCFAGSGVTIAGNHIGVDVTGTQVFNHLADPDRDPHGIGSICTDVTIGGDAPELANIIGGLVTHAGIENVNSENNKVIGNFIGTDVTGILDFGNHEGIFNIFDSPENVYENNVVANNNVGILHAFGSFDAVYKGNSIYSNDDAGIRMGQNGTNSVFKQNYIGTNKDGDRLGNGGPGIHLYSSTGLTDHTGAKDNLIAENVIAYNEGPGVLLGSDIDPDDGFDGDALRNAIVANSIFANGGLGIDLTAGFVPFVCDPSIFLCAENRLDQISSPDGVTPNDHLDLDEGANNFQNFPTLNWAKEWQGKLRVHGHLKSERNKSYRIDIYANDAADPSGNGEGQRHLGYFEVETNGEGNTVVETKNEIEIGGGFVDIGDYVTVTATELCTPDLPDEGNCPFGMSSTSEFSAAVAVTK